MEKNTHATSLVDPCVVCGKEHKCNDSSAGLWFQYKNKHAMTLVVDPCVVCGKNTHAMTLVDPYVVCGKNTHAMTTGGSMCGLWKRTHMQ